MQPTSKQATNAIRVCAQLTRVYKQIDLVRLDERTKNIYILTTNSLLSRNHTKWRSFLVMTKPNFEEMPLTTLKAYILEHRNDDEAFQIYITRKRTQTPNLTPMTIEEAEAELQRQFGQAR
jgi:hypothetical protein